MHKPKAIRTLVFLSLLATSAFAQQYTIAKIVFNGPTPYSQSALEAASGLKNGDSISKQDLQAASQRLVETGAFGALEAAVDGPVKAITVVFTVKPADPAHVLTASFENFVWLDPKELPTAVTKIVPLFNGTIPEAGNQQDAVLAALKQILAAKGVTAEVTMEPVEPSPTQPLRLVSYRVTSPDVRIHSLKLTGASGTFAPQTSKFMADVNGRRYNEGLTAASLSSGLLFVYKNAGHQAASITELSRTIASSTAARVDVDVTAKVEEGDLYRLAKLDWPGSPLLSSQDFLAEANLHPGDIASEKPLLESLARLESAYKNKGYMDVAVTATPHLDPSAHTVSFDINALPGPVYTLKSITPVNLNPSQQADFNKGWLLHPGDVYNEGYVSSFLKNNTALVSLNSLSASFKTIADPDNHTVDLTMIFKRSGQ